MTTTPINPRAPITIDIRGPAGSGKTTIADVLATILATAKFPVTLQDELHEGPDGPADELVPIEADRGWTRTSSKFVHLALLPVDGDPQPILIRVHAPAKKEA